MTNSNSKTDYSAIIHTFDDETRADIDKEVRDLAVAAKYNADELTAEQRNELINIVCLKDWHEYDDARNNLLVRSGVMTVQSKAIYDLLFPSYYSTNPRGPLGRAYMRTLDKASHQALPVPPEGV